MQASDGPYRRARTGETRAARSGAGESWVPPLLRDGPFRRYWTGQTISLFGDQVSAIALLLAAVLVLHASAAEMGYLGAMAR